MEVKCTEIVAFFQSDSNFTQTVSTRQFDCFGGSFECKNFSSPADNESCANLTSVNITICNCFTNTTSNLSYSTSETSETHTALSETSETHNIITLSETLSSVLPIVSYLTSKTSETHTALSKTSETHNIITLSETLSGCLPIVSYQTVFTNSSNVFEATYSIFVVAILLLLGTNIAFCIAFWIKRNQLKKVLQGELKKNLRVRN